MLYATQAPGTQALTYWSLDVVTGSIQNLGGQFPVSLTAATGPYVCTFQPVGSIGGGMLAIFDLSSGGAETEVDNVVTYATCPGSDGTLAVFRADPTTGDAILWTGPFEALAPVALGLNVQAVGAWLYDSSGAPSGVLVAAASSAEPSAFGLFTITLGSYAFTEDVPPTPASTAWATGAMPAGSLQSTSLATGSAQAIRPLGDHFLYSRMMSDGGTTMFVGPFSSGPASELALFQANPSAVSTSNVYVYSSYENDTPPAVASVAAWSPGSAVGEASTLMVWDDGARDLVSCPSSSGANPTGILSPDEAHALFVDIPENGYEIPGPATLLSLNGVQNGGGDGCISLASANAESGNFSPDSKGLFWTVAAGNQDQLWAAASDGSDARMIGTGIISAAHFLADSEKLEMELGGDLVWLDLLDDHIVLHDVVEQAFGGVADVGGSWLVIGYNFSTQDGTGFFGVVNRDTGVAHLISAEVASFRVIAEATASDSGSPDALPGPSDGGVDPAYTVVYLVRGRNPSPQDGIWVARVNTADLQ